MAIGSNLRIATGKRAGLFSMLIGVLYLLGVMGSDYCFGIRDDHPVATVDRSNCILNG